MGRALRAWARLSRRALPAPDRPVLAAGPVDLVPCAPEHYTAYHEAAASCEAYLRRWQPTWPDGHLSEASYRRRLALYERDWARGTGRAYHLFAGDTLVGMLRVSGVQRGAARSCEVGYWVAEGASNRGYAKAALRAACEGAEADGLVRVTAACAVGNAASLAVLSACGFAFEGVARSYLEVNGLRRDHHLLAWLAAEARERG